MNTFVGVPQPDSPHKPLLNLVDSVHIGAGASLFISAARTLACAGGFLRGSLGSFPLFGTRNLERFEENFGAPSVRLRRTACGTTAGRRCRSKAIAIRMNTYDSSVSGRNVCIGGTPAVCEVDAVDSASAVSESRCEN
jgi:hypothetical protein